jgi:hypothetical protein
MKWIRLRHYGHSQSWVQWFPIAFNKPHGLVFTTQKLLKMPGCPNSSLDIKCPASGETIDASPSLNKVVM